MKRVGMVEDRKVPSDPVNLSTLFRFSSNICKDARAVDLHLQNLQRSCLGHSVLKEDWARLSSAQK